MKSREELWNMLAELATEEGVQLFDVVWPAPRTPVLRVFISKSDKSAVDVEECATLSRRILSHEEVEALLPGHTTLEVSSPGINRKLRLPWHFAGAVGERVRVTFVEKGAGKRSITGQLAACDGLRLEVDEEQTEKKWSIPLEEVSEARVDFRFS